MSDITGCESETRKIAEQHKTRWSFQPLPKSQYKTKICLTLTEINL